MEQFELSLVIASVSIAAGGLVPGAMGMNLLSGYESSEQAFRVAVLVTLCVALRVSTFEEIKGFEAWLSRVESMEVHLDVDFSRLGACLRSISAISLTSPAALRSSASS